MVGFVNINLFSRVKIKRTPAISCTINTHTYQVAYLSSALLLHSLLLSCDAAAVCVCVCVCVCLCDWFVKSANLTAHKVILKFLLWTMKRCAGAQLVWPEFHPDCFTFSLRWQHLIDHFWRLFKFKEDGMIVLSAGCRVFYSLMCHNSDSK